jgi:hypothetical protein
MTETADRPRVTRILSEAWNDLRACWLLMAGNALLYTALATIILLPLIGVLFQFLIARTHSSAVADVDIARRLFTTAPGVIALLLALARDVVDNYATMSSAQRLFLFVMTRLGVREEISEPEGDLRP